MYILLVTANRHIPALIIIIIGALCLPCLPIFFLVLWCCCVRRRNRCSLFGQQQVETTTDMNIDDSQQNTDLELQAMPTTTTPSYGQPQTLYREPPKEQPPPYSINDPYGQKL